MSRHSALWFPLVLLCLVILSAAGLADDPKPPEEDYYELVRLLIDTLDEVERNYVKDVNRRQLVEAAIRGIFSELDPYSSYISPDEMLSFRASVESQFGDIGIRIAIDQDKLTVLGPPVGTPAHRAGIMAGDRIVKIDGQSTDGMRIDDAMKRLKGRAGTEVTLTVVHSGESSEHEVKIERRVVRVETVMGDHRKDDGSWNYVLDSDNRIGYVRISAFSRTTAAELTRVLDQLRAEGLSGLILDLRFNPGGLLESAVKVSDMFLSRGLIVSTKGRNSRPRRLQAEEPDTYEGFPMAVLVNGYSASASEIVSACLQDHGRAVIVGERTYGKGSVQNVIELEREPASGITRSALKLTTATYLRPSGTNIDRQTAPEGSDQWGVKPEGAYNRPLNKTESEALMKQLFGRDTVLPGSKTGDDKPAGSEGSQREKDEFVDPHVELALDYLTTELARADISAIGQ